MDHDQLLEELELWMDERNLGKPGHLSLGPSIMDVMAEFDLTEDEAIEALKKLGQRRKERARNDPRN